MAAQPKNKITRVERGRRRKGNTPKLLKDATVNSVPLHKRNLFGKFLQMVGAQGTVTAPATAMAAKAAQAETSKEASKTEEKEEKKSKTAKTTSGMTATATAGRPQAKAAGTVKKTTRTQHKGG